MIASLTKLAVIVAGLVPHHAERREPPRRAPRLQDAEASIYGDGDGMIGRRMADGQVYEPDGMGVANRTLPLGTRVRICYERCVTATVVDRGPYVAGRDFDLQVAVAQAIGFPGLGTIRWALP